MIYTAAGAPEMNALTMTGIVLVILFCSRVRSHGFAQISEARPQLTTPSNKRRYPVAAIAGPVGAFVVTAIGIVTGLWNLIVLGAVAFTALTFIYYVHQR